MIRVGDVVRFTDRFGAQLLGVVYREPVRIGLWISDEIGVYVPSKGGLYGVSWANTCTIIRAADEGIAWNRLQAAAKHYRKHLNQYPIWAGRFAADPNYPVLTF